MITSFELEKIIEKWWTNLNIQEVAETLDDIEIGGVAFRPWVINIFITPKHKRH